MLLLRLIVPHLKLLYLRRLLLLKTTTNLSTIKITTLTSKISSILKSIIHSITINNSFIVSLTVTLPISSFWIVSFNINSIRFFRIFSFIFNTSISTSRIISAIMITSMFIFTVIISRCF
jgi:hypothetical protein